MAMRKTLFKKIIDNGNLLGNKSFFIQHDGHIFWSNGVMMIKEDPYMIEECFSGKAGGRFLEEIIGGKSEKTYFLEIGSSSRMNRILIEEDDKDEDYPGKVRAAESILKAKPDNLTPLCLPNPRLTLIDEEGGYSAVFLFEKGKKTTGMEVNLDYLNYIKKYQPLLYLSKKPNGHIFAFYKDNSEAFALFRPLDETTKVEVIKSIWLDFE